MFKNKRSGKVLFWFHICRFSKQLPQVEFTFTQESKALWLYWPFTSSQAKKYKAVGVF